MAFTRNLLTHLINWKSSSNRKPLVLRGARQVGKTTLVNEFAQTYKHQILLNLEKSKDRSYFEESDEAKIILEALFLSNNLSIREIGDTLIFIDEIQESPQAIQMLRYFYEEFPTLHIIAAGSLLEFAMRKVKSFPVGRIEYAYLYPLNFVEYLQAIGHEKALSALHEMPIKIHAHPVLMGLFNQFVIVGGMPEIVDEYVKTNSLTDLPKVYESIWSTYQNDVEKYTSNETERLVIKHIISTAHLYIHQRIKFQNFGNSNYRSREVGAALRKLHHAMIIQLIYPTTDLEIPIREDLKKSPRLQFLDTGLLNYTLGIQAEMLSLTDLSSSYKGAIIPHIITQELISLNTLKNNTPNFWVREKNQASAEVDLIYRYENKIIPIEIKAGKVGKLKSLHQYVERSSHPYAVRIYAGKFKIEKAKTPGGKTYFLMNLPYYLGTKIPDYIDYFISNYRL